MREMREQHPPHRSYPPHPSLKPAEWQLDVIRTVTLLEDFVTKIL